MHPADDGNLALHLAAERGHLQTCVTLLNHMEACIGTAHPHPTLICTFPLSLLSMHPHDHSNNQPGN
jgi:hypothetical protein